MTDTFQGYIEQKQNKQSCSLLHFMGVSDCISYYTYILYIKFPLI